MATLLAIISYISANYALIIAALVGVLTALIGLFMLIPGEQPEKFLQSVVDFLAKFSVKKP